MNIHNAYSNCFNDYHQFLNAIDNLESGMIIKTLNIDIYAIKEKTTKKVKQYNTMLEEPLTDDNSIASLIKRILQSKEPDFDLLSKQEQEEFTKLKSTLELPLDSPQVKEFLTFYKPMITKELEEAKALSTAEGINKCVMAKLKDLDESFTINKFDINITYAKLGNWFNNNVNFGFQLKEPGSFNSVKEILGDKSIT